METNIYLSKYYDFFLSVLKKGRANFIVYPTLYQGKKYNGFRPPGSLPSFRPKRITKLTFRIESLGEFSGGLRPPVCECY